jgi:ABC-type branched-subunit amino acid transport system permease subunit
VGPLQQAMYGLLLIGLMIFRRRGLMGEYDFRVAAFTSTGWR